MCFRPMRFNVRFTPEHRLQGGWQAAHTND
jgi:hypothetical protein